MSTENVSQDQTMSGVCEGVEPKTPEQHAASCCHPNAIAAREGLERSAEQALENREKRGWERHTGPSPAYAVAHAAEDAWFGHLDRDALSTGMGVSVPRLPGRVYLKIRTEVLGYLAFRKLHPAARERFLRSRG